MNARYPSTPGGWSIRVMDAVLGGWVVACLFLGLAVANEVRELATMSDTLVTASEAVDDTGRALEPLEQLPFVGDEIRGLVDRMRLTAGEARLNGERSRQEVERLSTLLGISVAVIPTIPLLALYVPLRMGRMREVRAVSRLLRRSHDPRSLQELFGRRAVLTLPYHHLMAVTPDPWGDLEAGRFERLAVAELRHLGFRKTRWSGMLVAARQE